jgi:uncharacterized protein (DUF1778 family)
MPNTNDRINFRLDRAKKRVIERAAAIKGVSLTNFAVMTLFREASEVVKNEQSLVLSDRDRDAFLAALDNPPRPSPRLLRAAKAYKAARANGRIR